MSRIEPRILIPESKKTKEWIKEYLEYLKDIGVDSRQTDVDAKAWNYYNNQVGKKRFDYLTKVGNSDLPTQQRHIPLQAPLVNTLVSQQINRPFVFSVVTDDNDSVKSKLFEMLRAVSFDITTTLKRKRTQNRQAIIKIQQQLGMLQQAINKEPQSQEEAQQIQQMRMQLPLVQNQFNYMMEIIEEENDMTDEEIQETKRYYKYSFRDWKEEIAQKLVRKLRIELGVKKVSSMVFKSSLVTGKGFYYVDIVDGERYPKFEYLSSFKVVFPRIGNIHRIQNGPWVKVIETLSFQQIVYEFGDEIVKEYGESALKEIEERSLPGAGNNTTFVSTPGYNAMEYDRSYHGTFEDGHGIQIQRIFYRVPKKVKIKYSPNKYNGDFFRHFVDYYKIPVDMDEYYYREGHVINKNNPKLAYPKDQVEQYKSSKDQFIKTKYTTDIYQGVIIDGQYYVKCCKKEDIIRNPNKTAMPALPVFGRSFSSIEDQPKSVILDTMDLQDHYDVIFTMRELFLALSGPKSLIYDRSQKPDNMTDEEWLYQRKIGNIYIQTADKHGNPKRTTFNQFQEVDLAFSSSIQYLDNMLLSIEDTMGNIIGVPRARKGQVVQTDQVGTYKESIKRAYLITEILYSDHDEIEAEALTQLINLAIKYSWKDGSEIELNETDMGREIFKIPQELLNSISFRVIMYNSTEEAQKMQELKEIMTVGWSKGVLPWNHMLNIWDSDTLTQIKTKTEFYTKEAQKIQQEAAKADAQQQAELEERKMQMQHQFAMEIERLRGQIETMNTRVEQAKIQSTMAIEERNARIDEFVAQSDAKLKLLELINEKDSEDKVLANNDKHATNQERLSAIQMQLNALMDVLNLNVNVDKNQKDKEMNTEKVNVEKLKARKMVKEHASDK